MNTFIHFTFVSIACLFTLLASGGCTKNPDKGSDLSCDALSPACNLACSSDTDCGSPNHQLICANDGFCQAVCRSSADCNGPHDAFDGAPWKGCEFGGCTCVDFSCLVPDCFTSSECGAKVCRAGRCQDADTSFDRCEIFPGHAVLAVGGSRTFTAVAYSGQQPVLLKDKPAWSVANGALGLSSTDETGMRATFAGTSATQTPVQAVRATIGSVSCSSEVEVLASSSAPLRAVLVDESSGRLLSGATVIADMGTERIELEEEQDRSGSYVFKGDIESGALTLSAFHPDFDTATLAGIQSRDLFIPMRRFSGLKKGGVRGVITTLAGASSSNLSAGFAGLSVQGSLLDLGLDQFIAETVATDVSIAGLVDMPGLELPGGVVIGTKDTYFALGGAGPCQDLDKAKSGLCGNQAAFSLGFSLPITDLAPLASAVTGDGPLNYGALLSQALPILTQIELGMVRDVSFDLVTADAFSIDTLPTLDMTPSVAMARNLTLPLPPLPMLAGEETGVVAGAALSLVEDRGFVPLGLGAGVADSGGHLASIPIQLAAPQGGVEGSQFVFVAVALPANGMLSDGALGLSGLVIQTYEPSGVTFSESSGDFLALPDGGLLEVASGRRTVKGITDVEGANLYRLLFTMASGRRWTVAFVGGEVEVPLPPPGFEDLEAQVEDISFMVQALRLAHGNGFESLFGWIGDEGPSRLNAMVQAFSIHEAAAKASALTTE